MERNPPYNRFKYIAKQYGEKYPGVVIDTFTVLADTVGIEHPEQEYGWVRAAWRRVGGHGIQGQPISVEDQRMLLDEALLDLSNDERMARGRESDALWPWVAKELARVYRTNPEQYVDLRDRVLGRGPALSQWQRQEKIDLGRYKLGQALQLLEHFVVERKVPQGRVVYRWPDGWTIQKLVDPDQLEAEGEVMQHCVGDYCPAVTAGETIIYSLRDPQGRPHATMEYRESLNRFLQVQGKQNREPKPEYMERVEEFREAKNIRPAGLTDKEVQDIESLAQRKVLEAWDDAEWKPNFSVKDSEEADVEFDIDDVLVGLPSFTSVTYDDVEASGLITEIEEVFDAAAQDAWADKYSEALAALDDAIDEVASEAEMEAEEAGDFPDVRDLVDEVLNRITSGGGRADQSYIREEIGWRV